MNRRREQWKAWSIGIDPRRLVLIDETWTRTNMTRWPGRALRGQRLVEKIPHGHWNTTTLIAALDRSGVRCSMVLDGAVNGDAFSAFVETVLTPTVHPGDVVVMDNLSSHKTQRVQSLIRAAGAHPATHGASATPCQPGGFNCLGKRPSPHGRRWRELLRVRLSPSQACPHRFRIGHGPSIEESIELY